MRTLVGFALVAAAVVSAPVGAHATDYSCAFTVNWGDASKWTPTGFPNSPGDTATATNNATLNLADGSGSDASFTLGTLNGSKHGSYNLLVQNVAGGTGKLIFDNPAGNALVLSTKNLNKYCRFNVGVVLNTNLMVKSLANVGAEFNREISSGTGRTTGIVILPQDQAGSNQSTAPVVVNAAASYTGETRVMGSATLYPSTSDGGGKLRIGTNNALPVTTVLRVDGATFARLAKGGVLDLYGKNQEVAGVYGAAGYAPGWIISTNAAATLTINNAVDYDFAGSIGGATPTPVSVTKKGNGVQTLSGTNTYTGATTVEAGTLALAATGELCFVVQNGNVANRVTGSGTVELDGLFRLDVSAVTDTKGTWNLVDTATLAVSFGPTFGLAFTDGTEFTDRGDGSYTGTGGWTFSAASGDLTLTSPVLATLMVVR